MLPILAFEPITLAVVVAAALAFGLVALTVVWWMVKSAVRMAVKAVVFGALTLGALALVAAGVALLMTM